MIPEHELEAIAREAATAVRHEATHIAESDAALRTLLAAPPVPDAGHDLTEPAVSSDGERRRSLLWWGAAASVIALTVGALVWSSSDDGAIAPADTPARTVPPTTGPSSSVPATIPATGPAPASTMPNVVAPLTTPAATLPAVVELGTVIVAEVVTDEPLAEPDELYRAGIGTDVNQLGIEDPSTCSDCMYPWGPVVASDGRVVIADNVNQRWVVWSNGEGTGVPFPDNQRVIGQPVLDAVDRLYAVVSQGFGPQSNAAEVVVYQLDDLAVPIDSASLTAVADSRIWLTNTEVFVNGRLVPGVTVPESAGDRPSVEWLTGSGRPQHVVVTWQGQRRVWDFGLANIAAGASPAGLTDGSVLVIDVSANTLFRLFPDGSVVRQPRPGNVARGFQVTDSSMVVLQEDGVDLVTRRYPLPGSLPAAPADPMAGMRVPTPSAPSLDDVPRLIPSIAGLAGTMLRNESAAAGGGTTSHSQLWVRPAGETIDAVLRMVTPMFNTDGYTPIDVDGGWTEAYVAPTTDDIVILSLISESGSTQLWARGLTVDEVVALAASLRFTESGWQSPELTEWVGFTPAWHRDFAGRWLGRINAESGSLDVEIGFGIGLPPGGFGPPLAWDDLRLVSVRGKPAIISTNEYLTSVLWQPRSDVTAYVDVVDETGLDALAIAESMTEVQQTEWEQFAPVDPGGGDGCNSLFC